MEGIFCCCCQRWAKTFSPWYLALITGLGQSPQLFLCLPDCCSWCNILELCLITNCQCVRFQQPLFIFISNLPLSYVCGWEALFEKIIDRRILSHDNAAVQQCLYISTVLGTNTSLKIVYFLLLWFKTSFEICLNVFAVGESGCSNICSCRNDKIFATFR